MDAGGWAWTRYQVTRPLTPLGEGLAYFIGIGATFVGHDKAHVWTKDNPCLHLLFPTSRRAQLLAAASRGIRFSLSSRLCSIPARQLEPLAPILFILGVTFGPIPLRFSILSMLQPLPKIRYALVKHVTHAMCSRKDLEDLPDHE